MKTISAILIISSLLLTSCSKNLEDLNKDTKDATYADAGTFFAYSVKSMSDALQTITYNASGNPFSICRFFVQQVSCNTYNDGTNYYDQFTWTNIYSSVLNNLEEAKSVIAATTPIDNAGAIQKKNETAIIEVMNVYAYSRLVESFGNIPYTDALDINNLSPKYDDAKTVYEDLFKRLYSAIDSLDASGDGFGTYDLIYNDNVGEWKKFANSILLQMGLRIIDVDADLGTQAVKDAIAGGVFTSNSDNAQFVYLNAQPNTNPLWVSLAVGNRQDFIAAAPFVDELNQLNDPRRAVYFTNLNGKYVGAPYGQPVEYGQYSHFGDLFYTPIVPGIFLDDASVEFFLAEAAERGIVGSSADAESHYDAAIKASFEYYNVDGVDSYLAQPSVAYKTAAGDWKEKIGIQKWIALFNQGAEAWTEYRRLDYPKLAAPQGAFINIVPVRLLYPSTEQTLNGTNWKAASDAIGGDLMTTKLFWDKF